MQPYVHKVRYYETDKMGITHHANYIHWMEEARIEFLRQIGWGYDRMEACGIVSPVVRMECEYKSPSTFDDEIEVSMHIEQYTRAKLTVAYEMRNCKTGKIVCTGRSEHCFLDQNGAFLRLHKAFPELHALLTGLAEQNGNAAPVQEH